jgi:hypothetical protein
MNLIEVVDLLKELIKDCPDLDGNDFLIAPSKVLKSRVDGYEIHISGQFSGTTKKYLNNVAIQRKLTIIQHPNSVMMYESKRQ